MGKKPTTPFQIITEVYCDAGLITDPYAAPNKRNPSTIGGTWSYCHVYTDPRFKISRVATMKTGGLLTPGQTMHWFPMFQYTTLPAVENNVMELIAAIKCLMALPEGWSGKFHTDNKNVIGWLFGIDGTLYKMNKLPDRLILLAQEARARVDEVQPILLEGHPSKNSLKEGVAPSGKPVSEYNDLCDRNCTRLSKAYLSLYVQPKNTSDLSSAA